MTEDATETDQERVGRIGNAVGALVLPKTAYVLIVALPTGAVTVSNVPKEDQVLLLQGVSKAIAEQNLVRAQETLALTQVDTKHPPRGRVH